MENRPGLNKIFISCIAFAISSCSDSTNNTSNFEPETIKQEIKTFSEPEDKLENNSQDTGKKNVPFFELYESYSPGNLINDKLFLYHDNSTYILTEDNLLGKTVSEIASVGQPEDDVKTSIDEIRVLESSDKLPQEASKELRRNSLYGVKTDGDQYLFFDEALDSGAKILAFNDAVFSFNHGKEEYLSFLLSNTDSSIHTWRKSKKGNKRNYSLIRAHLKSVYLYKHFSSLSESFPSYESDNKKLAAIIMDLLIWDQISEQVSTQVKAQTWSQVGDEAWTKVWSKVIDGIESRVGNSIRNEIWAQISEKIRKQVEVRVDNHVLFKIWTQLRSQVEDQVKQNLWHLQFASAYREGSLNDAVKSAVDYTLTVYQLGSVVIRHSIEVEQIQDDLARFIYVEMETDEIQAVLENLNIPSVHEHYLIDNQLKIIRSHLMD
ncbi:MAG: hypothetical protein AB8G05_05805 [Oligoflexales bacterium]